MLAQGARKRPWRAVVNPLMFGVGRGAVDGCGKALHKWRRFRVLPGEALLVAVCPVRHLVYIVEVSE